jgi:hypothetical protein
VAVQFTVGEAAELADVKPAQLKLWLETNKFKPSIQKEAPNSLAGALVPYFTEADIARLIEFVGQQKKRKPTKIDRFVDDGTQTEFTVAQIASMWQLSTDTVQRMFVDEPGVITLGDKNPRGKRRRVTLRIPREVLERVKRRRSNT